MQEAVICLRYARAIVSQRIQTPRGVGYHPCINWQDLETEAFFAIGDDYQGGPFVFACPDDLARRALFVLPDAPAQPRLFEESEASK